MIFLIINKRFWNAFFIIASIFVALGSLFGNALNFYPLVNFFNSKLNQDKKNLTLKMLIWIELNDDFFEDYSLMNQSFINERRRKNRVKIVIYLFTVVLITMTIFSISNLSIDWLFSFVSTITVPPISFVFPSMLYIVAVNKGLFKKSIHKFLSWFSFIIGMSVWIFSIYSLFKIRKFN